MHPLLILRSSHSKTLGAIFRSCQVLNTSKIHTFLSTHLASHVLMKQTIPRTSHLDPINLNSIAPPIIFDKNQI